MKKPIWILLALLNSRALAHPLDEVVQGAYLTLSPGTVQLELDLTPGEKVAATVLKALDANGDQSISEAEAKAFAQRVLEQLSLSLDRKALRWTLDKVTAPPYQNLKLGSDTLKIYAIAKRTDQTGEHTLVYHNRYQPAKSQWTANIFLQPAAWQYQVLGQQRSSDGKQLTVKYTAARP